eukprot:293556-Rhodomonas_salina.2
MGGQGDTCLIVACKVGLEGAAKLLVEKNADVNAQNYDVSLCLDLEWISGKMRVQVVVVELGRRGRVCCCWRGWRVRAHALYGTFSETLTPSLLAGRDPPHVGVRAESGGSGEAAGGEERRRQHAGRPSETSLHDDDDDDDDDDDGDNDDDGVDDGGDAVIMRMRRPAMMPGGYSGFLLWMSGCARDLALSGNSALTYAKALELRDVEALLRSNGAQMGRFRTSSKSRTWTRDPSLCVLLRCQDCRSDVWAYLGDEAEERTMVQRIWVQMNFFELISHSTDSVNLFPA